MVNLKTKIDKHANDNEKRRKSIKEKERAKFNQSKIIQQALSDSSSLKNSNKKIIFNHEDDDDGDAKIDRGGSDGNGLNKNGKSVLFDSSDSDNENFEIKEKTQFSGKKGFELLNLQSTYGNDERFKIDERFLENEEEDVEEDKNKSTDNADMQGEKAAQLKILESVLGTSVVSPEKEKKKKRTYEMIRYDASNKDHEIYEKNVPSETGSLMFSKKRRENKKTLRTDKEELPKPKVSKDKFYEVSSEIKSRFKEKQDEGAQFSLLQTYGFGKNQEAFEEETKNESLERDLEESGDQEYGTAGNDFEKALQEEEEMFEQKAQAEEKTVMAKGIWKESFFFDQDDARFKDGLEFINKKESSEAIEAAENFDKTRKRLKEILRLHLKKQMHKKDPFRNKIGGMNKKQMASSKFKNPKMLFNKRRMPRV